MTEEEANAARPAPGEEGIYRSLGLTNGPQSHGLIQMALDYVYAECRSSSGSPRPTGRKFHYALSQGEPKSSLINSSWYRIAGCAAYCGVVDVAGTAP